MECAVNKYTIDPRKTALLVVDMQNDFVAEGRPQATPNARAIVEKLRTAINACRTGGIPIYYIVTVANLKDGSTIGPIPTVIDVVRERRSLVEGTPGIEVYPDLAPRSEDPIIVKHTYDAFYNTPLESALRSRGIELVVVSGVVTQGCVWSTATDAFQRGFRVILLSDATAAREIPDEGWGRVSADEMQRVFLAYFANRFGQVLSAEELAQTVRQKKSGMKA